MESGYTRIVLMVVQRAIVPEYRSLFDGLEKVDSFVINPHKWLFVPIECSVLYTRHPNVFREAFS